MMLQVIHFLRLRVPGKQGLNHAADRDTITAAVADVNEDVLRACLR
jgi:hypothetical protein